MKRRKEMKRRTKLMIYACLSVSLVAGAFGVSSVVAKTSADGSLISADLVMENGASLYLSEDGSNSGLKFTYTINGYDAVEDADRTFGMLVVPYDYLTKAGITDLTAETNDYIPTLQNAVGDTISNDPIVEMLTPTANGEVSLSIAPMLEQNYVRNFFAIGFEAITTDNGVTQTTTYQYAQQADNVRSVFEVANIAMNKFRHYEWTSSAQDQAEYALLETYEEDLTAYVSDGLTFVYGTANLDISLNATYVGGPANVKINTAKETGKESIELAMHWDMDTASLTRGNTTATVDLGGVCVGEDLSVAVLKDEAELGLYNTYYDPDEYLSANGAFFNDYANNNTKGDGALKLSGGYWSNASDDSSGVYGPSYVAFTNPDSEDGTYTLDENGWYVEFYFQGNNMPLVEFFGTTISERNLGQTAGKATGYVVHNGVATASSVTQTKVDTAMKAANNIYDTSLANSSTYKYGGIYKYSSAFRYGVSSYGGFDNSKLKQAVNATGSTGENTSLFNALDTGSSWTSVKNNTTVSTMKQCSLFSQMALIMNGTNGKNSDGSYIDFYDEDTDTLTSETAYFHYTVGMYKSGNTVYLDAKIARLNASSGEYETIATMKKALAETLSDGVTRTGYITVYGAMKGGNDTSCFSYVKPYKGTNASA